MTQNLPDNYDDEASPQSAELFHLIVKNVKDYAIFMTDADGFVVSWNPGVERLLGFTESEIVGQPVNTIFTPEDVAADVPAKEMERAGRTGCAEDKRWHRRKDDSRFWANGMLMPLKNADGGLRGFAKVMRDDTAQKLAEEELEQTNRHFENILESITDAFFTLDHGWRFTYLNKQSESLLQRKREELLGKNIWEEFPEAVETVVYEQYRKALAEQVAVNFEVFYAPLDTWAEVRVYPSPDGLSVYSQNITERNRAEENLNNQKTLLEALTESVLDGILIISAEGKMLHFNQHFLDIWHFPSEIVESKSDEAALDWAANQTTHPAAFLARVSAVYEQPETKVREELTMKDGRVFERFGAPIHSGNLRLGWVWTFRDITIRKRAETNFAFLAEISQELAGLTSVREITEAMTGKIGQYFGVSNCLIAEVNTTANTAIVDYCWRRDDNAVDLTGTYHLPDFISEEFRQSLIADRPVIIKDVATDSRTAENAAKFGLLKVGSFVNTPFVSDDSLKFILGVHRPEPYEWRADEVELLGEVMTRVWTRIERARAEELLRESQERFSKAFNASPLVLTISSLTTGKLIEVNETFVNATGYTREEVLGRTTLEVGLWKKPTEREAEMETVRQAGQIRNAEYNFRTKSGAEIVGLLSAEHIEIGGEAFTLTVIQDITEQKEAEEKIRESEES